MKKLTELLYNIKVKEITGREDILIKAISFDSRNITNNNLFIAVRGTKNDGHEYISQTIKNGASAIICEKIPEICDKNTTYIIVENSASALGQIASNYHDNPSENMNDEGCKYCFMEVSSHSVAQSRIAGLKFAGGIFTNLTHDHLDYHSTFDEYLKAKKGFFDFLPEDAFSLINADDKNGKVMQQNTKASKKLYALKTIADFTCKVLECHFDGMLINIDGTEIWSRLTGHFNAYNLLAVYGTARLLRLEKNKILKLLSDLHPAEGRFETIRSVSGKTAIVDYAHTPDALKNVLKTINEILKSGEKIITVTGAGGDRDRSKRPLMAKIASELSDRLILTSDNPRSENPEDIIHEMQSGIDPKYMAKVIIIVDRKQAIRTACLTAGKSDIILVAGKGHEKYQEINGVKYHFNDIEIIKEVFNTEKPD
ncbi:MAG: UDP-N-acetylmuramoyl-L-alanyl-D-glutamate--2,6-diaminopimelate ligase [Bacteroidia bacterium]|nr:UDP-N-acetylmuramoyl-L-alanyl-D-glutamate--2,6-diaminopimelate ligase [Bacteroidia bacterium]